MLSRSKATKDEYVLILEIWEKSVRHTHDFLAEEDIQFYKNVIPEYLENVDLVLWKDEQRIIGFSGTSEEELVMLFLDPIFIGKQYGSEILMELIASESIKRIDVNTQNEHAKRFYLNHGFEIESEDAVDGFGKPYPITHLVK
ncbi:MULTISPECIES: GNAT family N-acetyltransferase [Enterococcus]|uniref:N-acetyltransferase domain-containing protein n=1 Tax=Enterococcus sulfureus ATCC 49903 TaxID=1140003 RepID=S0KNY3_9ENTE|nr:GNAT family N-acetyltransferase [Enterococcus sulfureus]EOT46494.1 hypothetical protein OMY_01643 [Enterococcus sulfureus ATCC 49903]EOT86193.1 hypothetical protein I573_00946 [Enterococcus sulfureus ATCC 49903]